MSVYIMTDSAADLPKNIITEFNLDVLPLSIALNDEEFFDGVTLGSKELMDRMRLGDTPKTSQVTSDAFAHVFEKYIKSGDSIIYAGFSSALSGTYNSANIAKAEVLEHYPNADITLIDTKCVSMGLGIIVYKALIMLKNGATKEEIIEAILSNSKNMNHIFTVDDLEYLFRGGRVSRAAALVGGLLGIKPVLEVNDDGVVAPLEKVRGRKNSIKRVAEIAGERGKNLDNQIIGICHGDDMESANILVDLLKESYGCKEFVINNIGCVVGSHAGPGTVGVFFLK